MIDGIVNDNSIGWSTKTDPSPYEANLTIKLIQKQKISEIRIWPKIGGSEEEMFVEGFPIDFTLEISADGEEWIPVVQKPITRRRPMSIHSPSSRPKPGGCV